MTSRLFLFVLVLLLFAGCRREPVAEVPAAPTVAGSRVTLPVSDHGRAFAVEAATAAARPARQVTGRLAWDEEVTVRVYSPVAGRVREVAVDVGRRVERGAVLAWIDSADFAQAQADARKAEADLRLADATLARTRDLVAHGALARKELEVAEDAAVAARAERDRAAMRLTYFGDAGAEAVDGRYALRAPVDGVVVERNLNRGQEVRSDQQLANAPTLFAPQFVLTEPARLWVQLDVTETEIAGLRPGQELRLRSRAYPGREFAGRLESVGAALDPATRTVRARGTVANDGLLLKAEMYVDVEVDAGGPAEVVAVGRGAIFAREGRDFVFVESGPGVYDRREVELGAETGGRVEVRRGLRAGERVVTAGCLQLESVLEDGGKS